MIAFVGAELVYSERSNAVDPDSVLNSIRKEIWAVDRDVALADTGPLESYLEPFY